ncbi:MAG: hypothetical protein ACP5XB_09320 [Isosphaeraceae bacterium]
MRKPTVNRSRSASIYTGMLFFMFYWLETPEWDLNSLPRGWRSEKHGDVFLCEELTKRHLTLHERIKAYGANVGAKGNQRGFRPMDDARYGPFLKSVAGAPVEQRIRIADYLAQRFAESRRVSSALPPVGPDVLTFARAKNLLHKLISTASTGHVQQFLIAALLFVYRRRTGIEVTTHHTHASDTSDQVAGDVEERRNGELLRAYEVTVRSEWKARISSFRDKMDRFRLTKYVIIARDVNNDEEWATPAKLALKVEPYGRDIAIVDILDVVNFLAAKLTPSELREAVNKCYEYLADERLCGAPWVLARYREVVRDWATGPGDANHGAKA